MNEAKVREILGNLISDVEALAAGQGVLIATLRNMSKGTFSAADVENAIVSAKSSNRHKFDGYRKALDEL